jgi:ABC-type multidrug transport system fused ATPase/permease subunit
MSAFGGQLRRYSRVLGWFLRDALWSQKVSVALAVFLSFAGVTARVSAFGLALYYARVLDRDRPFHALGRSFAPRESYELLLIVALGVMAALLIGAALIYLAEAIGLRLAARYECRCVGRAMQLLSGHLDTSCDQGRGQQELRRLSGGDARLISRVLRMLLKLIEPVLVFLVAMASLFYIHAPLTLGLIALLAAGMMVHYRINRRGADSSRNLEASARGANKERGEMLSWAHGAHMPNLLDKQRFEQLADKGCIRRNREAYVQRVIVVQQCQLTNDVLFSLGVLIIFLALGLAALQSRTSWGILVVYLVATKAAMVRCRTVATFITSINRFFPQMRRYYDFVQHASTQPPHGGLYQPSHRVTLAEKAIEGSATSFLFTPGSRLAALVHEPLNRYTAVQVLRRIGINDPDELNHARGSLSFVSADPATPPMSIRDLLGPECKTREDAARMLGTLRLAQPAREQLPDSFSRPLTPETWKAMEYRVRQGLLLLGVRRSTSTWVLLDSQVLDCLPARAAQSLLGALNDRIVIAVHSAPWDLAKSPMEHAAVTDAHGLIGLGTITWAREHQDQIACEMQDRRPLDQQSPHELPDENLDELDVDVL